MIIPDMLKNAPMFKRLDAKIKVNLFMWSNSVPKVSVAQYHYMCNFCILQPTIIVSPTGLTVTIHSTKITIFDVQGKGSSGVGVGRGRASTLQAKVSNPSIMHEIVISICCCCCAFRLY